MQTAVSSPQAFVDADGDIRDERDRKKLARLTPQGIGLFHPIRREEVTLCLAADILTLLLEYKRLAIEERRIALAERILING